LENRLNENPKIKEAAGQLMYSFLNIVNFEISSLIDWEGEITGT
jgi:hypothetical protein